MLVSVVSAARVMPLITISSETVTVPFSEVTMTAWKVWLSTVMLLWWRDDETADGGKWGDNGDDDPACAGRVVNT